MYNVFAKIIIIAGIIFVSAGSAALLLIPSLFEKLEVSIKSLLAGICLIFAGVFLETGLSNIGIKAIACIILLFIIIPVLMNALCPAQDGNNRENNTKNEISKT